MTLSDELPPNTGRVAKTARAGAVREVQDHVVVVVGRGTHRDGIELQCFSRNRHETTTAAAPVADHTKPDSGAGTQAVLDQTAQALQSNGDWKMRVVGHTDSVGSSANDQLAQQRATSVMQYLVSHGVNQSRLSVDAKGASEPVSSNATDAGRAENRRVELIKQS